MNDFDRLALDTETIRDLTADELAVVAGGDAPPTFNGCITPVLPTYYCTGTGPTGNVGAQ